MPIQRCKRNGKLGWKWGKSGKCYLGPGGKAKARRQERAIRASGWTENRTEIKPRNPLKADPTRTATLRRIFAQDINRRFAAVRRAIVALLVEEDAFGLRPRTRNPFTGNEDGRDSSVVFVISDDSVGLGNSSVPKQPDDREDSRCTGGHAEADGRDGDLLQSETPQNNVRQETLNQRFRFLTTPEQVQSFQTWLGSQTQSRIIGVTPEQIERAWWTQYVEDGYKKGAGRAFDDASAARRAAVSGGAEQLSFFAGSREQFLRQSFARPESIEKVQLLTGRVFTELKGVTDQMAQQLTRELADGLVQGQNPRQIARNIQRRVGISKNRANVIARTEIVRAHAEGQLDALEQLGVEKVGVAVEWSTAADDRVCPRCQPLEGVVMSIKEARGILPRHPSCRCAYVPANVGEDPKGQKRSKAEIDAAFRKSLKADIPKRTKRTIAQQRTVSRWPGADLKRISRARPTPILDVEPADLTKFVEEPKAGAVVTKFAPKVDKVDPPPVKLDAEKFTKNKDTRSLVDELTRQATAEGNLNTAGVQETLRALSETGAEKTVLRDFSLPGNPIRGAVSFVEDTANKVFRVSHYGSTGHVPGTGTELMRYITMRAKKRGFAIELNATDASRVFFEKLGFTNVGGNRYRIAAEQASALRSRLGTARRVSEGIVRPTKPVVKKKVTKKPKPEPPTVPTPAQTKSLASDPEFDELANSLMDKTTLDGVEHGAVFDSKGKKIWQGSGKSDQLDIPADVVYNRGPITTVHTHPLGGSGFSDGDWVSLIDNVNEVESIVETENIRYVLRRTNETAAKVSSRIKRNPGRDWERISDKIRTSRSKEFHSLPTMRERMRWLVSETNKEMSKLWGYEYQEIRKAVVPPKVVRPKPKVASEFEKANRKWLAQQERIIERGGHEKLSDYVTLGDHGKISGAADFQLKYPGAKKADNPFPIGSLERNNWEENRKAAQKWRAHVNSITKTIDKAPNYQGTLYRGMNLDARQVEQIIDSGELSTRAITSWSKDPKIAEGFGGGKETGWRFVGDFKGRANSADISFTGGEGEILTGKVNLSIQRVDRANRTIYVTDDAALARPVKAKSNKAWVESWSTDEQAAFKSWVEDFDIGGIGEADAHREIKQAFLGKKVEPEFREKARLMKEALDRAPDHEGLIYRGIGGLKDQDSIEGIGKLEIGKEFSWKVPSSATKDRSILEEFTFQMTEGGETAVRFNIRSKTGVDISGLGGDFADMEKEVLLRPNTRYKVSSFESKKATSLIDDEDINYVIVNLEEL